MLSGFIEDRKLRGVRQNTLDWYRTYLAPWLAVRPRSESTMRTVLCEYLARYDNSQTRRAAWRAVKAYESWRGTTWTHKTTIHFDPAPIYPPLTHAEFCTIMDAQNIERWTTHRDVTVFSLLYYTGARLSAILGLRREDVDVERRALAIATKGGVRATIGFAQPGARILEAWYGRGEFDDVLFPSSRNRGRPVSRSSISRVLPRWAKQVGFTKRVWVHGLRHSAATHMVEHGMPVVFVQRQLLHTKLQTTEAYLHVSNGPVVSALDQAFRVPAGPASGP